MNKAKSHSSKPSFNTGKKTTAVNVGKNSINKEIEIVIGFYGKYKFNSFSNFNSNWKLMFSKDVKNRTITYFHRKFTFDGIIRFKSDLDRDLTELNKSIKLYGLQMKIFSLYKNKHIFSKSQLENVINHINGYFSTASYEIMFGENFLNLIHNDCTYKRNIFSGIYFSYSEEIDDEEYVEYNHKESYLIFFDKYIYTSYYSLMYIKDNSDDLFRELLTESNVMKFCRTNSIDVEEYVSKEAFNIGTIELNRNHRLG